MLSFIPQELSSKIILFSALHSFVAFQSEQSVIAEAINCLKYVSRFDSRSCLRVLLEFFGSYFCCSIAGSLWFCYSFPTWRLVGSEPSGNLLVLSYLFVAICMKIKLSPLRPASPFHSNIFFLIPKEAREPRAYVDFFQILSFQSSWSPILDRRIFG